MNNDQPISRIVERQSDENLVNMQRHRDAWRRYAYGEGEKPKDFLDGNMVDRQQTAQEKLRAELSRVRGLLQRTCDMIELMIDGDLAYQPGEEEIRTLLAESKGGAESVEMGKVNRVDEKGSAEKPSITSAQLIAAGEASPGFCKKCRCCNALMMSRDCVCECHVTKHRYLSISTDKLRQEAHALWLQFIKRKVSGFVSTDDVAGFAAEFAIGISQKVGAETGGAKCTFCGKSRADELHQADSGLLAYSSLTTDDYHNFALAESSLSSPKETK